MVKINKMYTGKGDGGKTHLVSGKRVSKADLRIKANGAIDELNAIMGIVRVKCSRKIKNVVAEIQNDLFDLGADISYPLKPKPKFEVLRITDRQVIRLERTIDKHKLPELNSFILPGGTESASFLHIARTVARRAEIQLIELSNREKINVQALKYMNRLSSLLFSLSRVENNNGKKDLWKPGKNV